MKIIVEEVKKLLEVEKILADLSTNYVTLFFEKRSLIMLSNLLFANKFIRKLPQKISRSKQMSSKYLNINDEYRPS